MEKPEIIEYPKKCPVCGGEEILIASLAAKEIEKGINPGAVPHYLQSWPFVMRNRNQPAIIGSSAPGGNVFIDVCKGCGIVRAIRIEIGEAMALDRPTRMG